MRRDHLEHVRRTCIKLHAAGSLPEYNPVHPWDVRYREAAKDENFWDAEVMSKVRDLKDGFVTAELI